MKSSAKHTTVFYNWRRKEHALPSEAIAIQPTHENQPWRLSTYLC